MGLQRTDRHLEDEEAAFIGHKSGVTSLVLDSVSLCLPCHYLIYSILMPGCALPIARQRESLADFSKIVPDFEKVAPGLVTKHTVLLNILVRLIITL